LYNLTNVIIETSLKKDSSKRGLMLQKKL